jgi:hypothetical protein
MVEDEETQRRGIVTVGVIVSPSWSELEFAVKLLHSSLKDLGASIDRWCPLKCNAHHHWIYDNVGSIKREIEKEEDQSTRPSTSDSATDRTNNYDASKPPEPSNQGDNIPSDKPRNLATSTSSGQLILDTIMGCMGREYRIRTRIHQGGYFDADFTCKVLSDYASLATKRNNVV